MQHLRAAVRTASDLASEGRFDRACLFLDHVQEYAAAAQAAMQAEEERRIQLEQPNG